MHDVPAKQAAYLAGVDLTGPARHEREEDRVGQGSHEVRETVGISLIRSAETSAAVEMVAKEMPNAKSLTTTASTRPKAEEVVSPDMANSDRLGRDYAVHDSWST